MARVISHTVKISSVREREKELHHFISARVPFPICKITKKMYRDRKFELKEKYSHSYVSGIHACGRMLFRYAVELGLIRHNPAENFQLPKRQISIEDLESQKEASDFLDKDEIAHFLTWQKKWGWKWITSFKGVYSTHLY